MRLRALLGCLLLTSSLLQATDQSIGGFLLESLNRGCSIEASALYWRTCRDDRVFAINEVDRPTSFVYSIVKPENHWGWRIRGTCDANDCNSVFFNAEYTYYNAHDHQRVVGESINLLFPANLESSDAKVHTLYQRALLRGGCHVCDGYRGNIYVFGGAGWIFLKERDRLTGITESGADALFQQKSQYSAAGFDAGLGGCWTPWENLGVQVEVSGIGAIGRRWYSYHLEDRETPPMAGQVQEGKYPPTTLCCPGYDFRVEAFYRFVCFCPFAVGVGYEHIEFFNVLLLNSLFSRVATVQPRSEDMGFSGLYLSLKVNY